jgi:hypothetical protein
MADDGRDQSGGSRASIHKKPPALLKSLNLSQKAMCETGKPRPWHRHNNYLPVAQEEAAR